MRLKKINSRAILAVGYDANRLFLEVKFKISKRIYGYLNVPKEVFEDFMNAKSKGSFFNQKIKDRYKFILLQS
jgi:lysyl-tRNA synthetase class 2